jgi:thermostable 8-oxoguanine DNA glycosylase
MNEKEKKAREALKKTRGPGVDAIHVTKHGGRNVDNFDVDTVKDRHVIRNLSDSIKVFRKGQ